MKHDVLVIGSGAGGGTLAWALAKAGRRVLLLERGETLPREAENWDTRAVFIDHRYKPREDWFDADGRPFRAPCHYFVGGNTKFYGAALMRFRREDFGALIHAEGTSPAWPVTYDEMEPFYAAAETLYGVRGTRGFDPTDPPASAPYPFPAMPHEPRIAQLWEDLKRAGTHPFPMPMALSATNCIRCATCGGYPCKIDAKNDAEMVCVRPALATGNLTLETGVRIDRLVAHGGRVTEAIAANGKVYSAPLIVVAAGAVNSAALLLRSGLANASDQLGRNLMLHNVSSYIAVSREPHDTKFQKTIGVNDWYLGDEGWGFPLGNLQLLARSKPETLSEATVRASGLSAEKLAAHAIDFCVMTEDLPAAENRVTLRPDGTLGVAYRLNNLKSHRRLVDKLESLVPRLDCDPRLVATTSYTGAGGAGWALNHQCGTTRFGDDPRTSVLDRNCRVHDVENLHVVDAGFMPSAAAVNPSLTIIANALRVAEHLVGD